MPFQAELDNANGINQILSLVILQKINTSQYY